MLVFFALLYSHELQTCDWPRNVDCIPSGPHNSVVSTSSKSKTTSAKPSNSISPLTQFVEYEFLLLFLLPFYLNLFHIY